MGLVGKSPPFLKKIAAAAVAPHVPCLFVL